MCVYIYIHTHTCIYMYMYIESFPGGSAIKNWPAVQKMQETWVQSLGCHFLTHSCIPAWRIAWTEEPSRLQSMRSRRVSRTGQLIHTHTHTHTHTNKSLCCRPETNTTLKIKKKKKIHNLCEAPCQFLEIQSSVSPP